MNVLYQENGTGTYRNPVIPLDYSDPDVIRVEEDGTSHFYYVASSFMDVPGVPVLHSRDLVNWEIAGYAVSDFMERLEHYSSERMDWYEYGIYAPTIRYHAGKFYVYVPIYPDGGICVSIAERAEGPWHTEYVTDKKGLPISFPKCRLTDVCPFWDDDGKAYLILSNLESQNLGIIWQSEPETVPGSSAQLFLLSEDGKVLLDADASSAAAFARSGVSVRNIFCTEGNKIYKKDGWYYFVNVCFLGNSPNGRGLYIRRARNIYGNEGKIVESDGFCHAGSYEMYFWGKPEEIPTQGAFFDTGDGRWFFMGQMPDDGAGGRTAHLIPVQWEKNQFPSLLMAEQYAFPLPFVPCGGLTGSDDFKGKHLKPWWNWNHLPDELHYQLTGNGLRIYAQRRIDCGCRSNVIWGVRNVLFQKYVSVSEMEFTVFIDLSGMEEGQEAGMVHFNGGDEFTAFYILYQEGQRTLFLDASDRKMRERRKPHNPNDTQPPFILNPDHFSLGEADDSKTMCRIAEQQIWLKTVVKQTNHGQGELGDFFYSLDGKEFVYAGRAQIPDMSRFRGNRIGLYTCNDKRESGYVEFRDVIYRFHD